MTEEFLHYIWKLRLFNCDLFSSENEEIQILKSGEHNRDAGPDFFNAKIKIGDTVWAGNVEIHVKASDWVKHNHHHDKSYSNVILHVVYELDQKYEASKIPVLELKNKFSSSIWNNYKRFQESTLWIPCEKQLKYIDNFLITNWLERLLVERLENKTTKIIEVLKFNNNNWEETFYQLLAFNFGFKINAIPFHLLSKSLALKYLAKHKNNPLQIEAMIFGQAGFLFENFTEQYPNVLKEEYNFLRQKYQLKPIEKHLWKFLRLRPLNFPTIRIAQFAQLIYKSTFLFSKIIESRGLEEIEKLFKLKTSSYWETHFLFDKPAKKQEKNLGTSSIQNIIINTIIPCLFAYGESRGENQYKEKALHYLENITSEDNSIIEKWKKLGIRCNSAYYSQALLQLRNEYCIKKNCLNCDIGKSVIKNNE